jgi:hypothetical protein
MVQLSCAPSLAPTPAVTRIDDAPAPERVARGTVQSVRIHETIHGRPYVIEVVSVSQNRWRAQIARRGATTALMPFYGATPAEAAQQLASWLTRAGERRRPAGS